MEKKTPSTAKIPVCSVFVLFLNVEVPPSSDRTVAGLANCSLGPVAGSGEGVLEATRRIRYCQRPTDGKASTENFRPPQ